MADQQDSPAVSQQVVSSFLSVPNDKKPQVLAKLSPAAKQTLLNGIAAQKVSTPQRAAGFLPSHMYQQAKEGVQQLASGTWGMAKDVLSDKPFSETYHQDVIAPLEDEMRMSALSWKAGKHADAVSHYLASYMPFLGPWMDQLTTQIQQGDIGGALAKGGSQMLAGAVGSEALSRATSGTIGAVNPREAMRYVSGAGDLPAGEAAKVVGEKNVSAQKSYATDTADVAEANRRSLMNARSAHEQRVSDIDFENNRAKAAYEDSVKKVKSANAEAIRSVQSGKAADVAAQMSAENLAEVLPKLHEAESAKASAMYPKISGVADAGELRTALSDVAGSSLKGTERLPSSLSRVMDDLKEPENPLEQASVFRGSGKGGRASGTRGVPMQEGISTMDPKARARFLESLSPEERKQMETGGAPEQQPLTFDKLHGYYSELGRELYSRDLAGDERAALNSGRKIILDKMNQMAEAEGKTERFKAAQKNWAKLENTFRNTDPVASGGSPIARALRARDPITGTIRPDYLRQILSDPKAYKIAQEMLGRYGTSGELRKSLELMKQHADLAKSAPKTAKLKEMPGKPPEKPIPSSAAVSLKTPPEAPTPQTFDLEKWRQDQMKKYAIGEQKMRPYNFMPWRIPFTIAQQLISKMLSNPSFRKWVSQ